MNLYKTSSYIWNHPLNRKDRLAAISRFVKWQLASRVLGQPVLLPFIDDTVLLIEPGMAGATGNWYCGLHEYWEMSFVLKFLRSGDLFVDVGANVGSYTVLASGAVGAHTVALEPVPSSFSRLEKNIRVNGISRLVQAHCVGASDVSGRLPFSIDQDATNRVLSAEDPSATFLPVVPIDELLRREKPTFIKMDLEGHELSALKGAERTLQNQSLAGLLIETNQNGGRHGLHQGDVVAFLRKHGFQPYVFRPETLSLVCGTGDNNTLFLRNTTLTQHRLASAPSFQLSNARI